MSSKWMAFMEMFLVFGFVLGWAVLELVAMRLDKRKAKENKAADDAGDPSP